MYPKFQMIENIIEINCSKHKQLAQAANISPDINREARILCEKCVIETIPQENIIDINTMILFIEAKLLRNREEYYTILLQLKGKLELLITQCSSNMQSMILKFQAMLSQIQTWYEIIQDKINKLNLYSIMQEIDDFAKKITTEKQTLINQLINNNQSFLTKVNNSLSEIIDLKNIRQLLQEISNNDYSVDKDTIKNRIKIQECKIEFKSVEPSVEQKEQCNAVVFNNQGSIMISTCDNQIRVWGFKDGLLKLALTLSGHKKSVQCLFFSKLNNYFISSSDESILTWILCDRWSCQQIIRLDKVSITCISADLKEEQVFFGSSDNSIQVWQLNRQNKIKKHYDLIKHNQQVSSLSLNESETILVSCAEVSVQNSEQIIVWQKISSRQNHFQFKCYVNQSCKLDGPQLKFFDENQFILICKNLNVALLFVYSKGQCYQRVEKNVNLVYQNQPERLFPILYNKEKRLLYFKVQSCIYILNSDFVFQSFLQSNGINVQGAVTNDGKYLVFWDEKKKGYQTQQICYP